MKKTVCTILAAAMSICVYTNAYASDYTQPDIEYVQSEVFSTHLISILLKQVGLIQDLQLV